MTGSSIWSFPGFSGYNIINGFLASGIPQSVDKGEPYLDESDNNSDECSSEDDSEVDNSEADSEEDWVV